SLPPPAQQSQHAGGPSARQERENPGRTAPASRKSQRQTKAQLDKAARQYILAVHEGRHEEFEPAELGFDFSLGQIELRAMDIKPDLFAPYERQLAEAEAA